MKLKIEIVGMQYVNKWVNNQAVVGPAISYGELIDNGIIDIRLPYFVPPEVIQGIEDAYCRGERKGEVVATEGAGGTTTGKYLWEVGHVV